MSEYKRQCPLDGGSCGEGGQCIVCRSEGLQIELAAAKERIAELEATIAAIESADWTHMEEAQDRIAELVEALELIAESCDVGRHDGLPEEGPALCATESWLIAKDALVAYRKGSEE